MCFSWSKAILPWEKKAYENLINYYLEFLFEKRDLFKLKFKYKFKLHYLIFFPSNNCSTPIQCYDKFAMVLEKGIDLNYVPKQRETVRLKLK